jgi:hypothetical protein
MRGSQQVLRLCRASPHQRDRDPDLRTAMGPNRSDVASSLDPPRSEAAASSRTGLAVPAHVQLFTTLTSAHIGWRLLSGNNREIGRGANAFPDVECAVVAIKQSQLLVAAFEPRIRRIATSHWRWELLSADVPHIASGHSFDRQIRCEQGLEQFLSVFITAPISSGLMVSGSRRGR